MKRDLYALLTGEDARTLTSLARAIRYAARRDHLPVWRAFVLRVAP